jgi:hypothetical protein
MIPFLVENILLISILWRKVMKQQNFGTDATAHAWFGW